MTLLHLAAKGGNPQIVQTVLFHLNDSNPRDDLGRTPMRMALNSYCVRRWAFQVLIERGGDPDITDNEGFTLLHSVAKETEDIFYAKHALNKSTKSINALDNYGRTPLHFAVYYDKTDYVRLFIQHEADPFIENRYGYSPLSIAAAMGTLDMMRQFTKYEYSGEAMLGMALAWGNRDIILYLLEEKIIPSDANKVHFAAARGDNEELSKLLSHNSSLQQYNFTELMKEITKEYLHFTARLEDDEVDIINPLDFKLTPLDMAIFFHGSLRTIDLLVDKLNIDFLRVDGTRWTSLDMAAFCGKESLVRYLIGKGVNVDFQGQDSWTAMHKAAWGGHSTIVKILFENHADINREDIMNRTPLHIAAMRGYNITVDTITKLSADSLNKKDRYDFTPLHLAEIYGHQKFFEILEDTSITVDPQDRYNVKDPGLVHSKLRNHTRTIELLIEKNAQVDVQDKAFGWSALHWATAIGDLEVVRLLVEGGAKLNLPSKTEQTPLYLARFWGRQEIYNFLRRRGGVW